MNSIEELLLIVGVTPELYFDLNRDPAERETLAEDEVWLSLPDVLTVNGDPKGRLNVNTAQRLVLEVVARAWNQSDTGLFDRLWNKQLEGGYLDEEELKKSVQKRLRGGRPKSGKKW